MPELMDETTKYHLQQATREAASSQWNLACAVVRNATNKPLAGRIAELSDTAETLTRQILTLRAELGEIGLPREP